jgi:acetoacetate decarboxylase
MPLTSPAYPPGPYRFVNREYLVITYRTDREKLRALVPEPLLPDGDTVKYEFMRWATCWANALDLLDFLSYP